MFDDLRPTREDWAVQVRISRLWESQNLRNNNKVISLDMILIDEHVIGELYFSSTSTTRIYINIEVPHVKSLADRFSTFAPKTKRIESKEVIHISDEEDMIKNRKRITDIMQMEWVDDQQVNDDGKEFHVVQVSSKVRKFTFINSDEESCEEMGNKKEKLAPF
ncbi:hypothetical protein Scep_014509 [Stephania cephalantha]|uniref:DUF223 domain-containing protein n=1 Tax=Stephania cephalantha TaxID=152367 RepID=A0AAP0P0G2_9MAGN